LLAAVVVVAVALLVWQPWDGASPMASSTRVPTATPTEPSIEPSLIPPPLASGVPSPGLTPTSNVEPGSTPPGATTVFDATSAQALFATADQIASALPASVGTIVPSTAPATGWGLPPGGAVIPATCQTARTVVAQQPVAYAARDWMGDATFTVRQEVALLDSPQSAQHAFATLVGTVDACATYTEVDPATGPGRWVTQPAVAGAGLYASIVQQVTFQGPTTTNGFRGHLLVGNAIVTWTAWTTGSADSLGRPDGLSAVVQDRALAAVRAAA
jgi:hypothetical protein